MKQPVTEKNDFPLTAYVLSFGGHCNNHCGICFYANRRGPAPAPEDILREAERVAPHFDGFILSDGEPALLPELDTLLPELAALAPRILQVHTNGRMFAYRDYAARFRDLGGFDFVIKVYSHRPDIHDAITGVEGSCVQTWKGLRNLCLETSRRFGVHVEVPLLCANAADVPQLVLALRQLRLDSVFLTGGYPAMGAQNLEPGTASDIIGQCRRQDATVPVHAHYARGPAFAGGLPRARESRVSGKWLAGADTNNPFVFRGGRDPGMRALLISMPNTPGMNVRLFLAAPASLAALNGFLQLLGYGCDMIDLEVHPAARSGVLNPFCDPDKILSAGASAPADDALSDVLWSLLEPFHPRDYAVTGLSVPDFIQTYLGAHLAARIRSVAPQTAIAVGPLRHDDRPRFDGVADFVCESRIFGEYFLAGLMNRLEFGDRCRAALYGNNLSPLESGVFLNMMCDLKKLPCPGYGTLDATRYLRPISPGLHSFLEQNQIPFAPETRIGFAMYYASRGCRHRCSCCGNQYPLVQRSPAQAARHLDALAGETGLTCFFMLDTAINNREDFLVAFCEELIRLQSPVLWMVSARPDFSHADLPRLMRAAGCVMLTLGAETGSDFILRKLRKGFRVAAVEKSLQWITDAGIMTSVNLMSGFVGEREEDVDATVDFIRRNRERIDFIGDHTSFVWYDGIRMSERAAGVRFRPGLWQTPQGPSRTFDEVDGRPWESILEFKKQAFSTVESAIADFHNYDHAVREYDIFHLFSLGHDRRLARQYLRHIAAQGHGQANYIFRDWMKYFIEDTDAPGEAR